MAHNYREHSSRRERGRSYDEDCTRDRRSSQAQPSRPAAHPAEGYTHGHENHYYRTLSHNFATNAEPDPYYPNTTPSNTSYQHPTRQTAPALYAHANRPGESQTWPYIDPNLPEHRGGTSRTRHSFGEFAAAEAQRRDANRRPRHEDDHGQKEYERGPVPYIAPILPEHRSGILEARQEINNAQAQQQNMRNRRYTRGDDRGERLGYEQNERTRTTYAYDQYQYQQHVTGTSETQGFSQRHHSAHEQPETKSHHSWKPADDHKPDDSEFDYVFDTEDSSLQVNPNPKRRG